jgi:hypothetical protein
MLGIISIIVVIFIIILLLLLSQKGLQESPIEKFIKKYTYSKRLETFQNTDTSIPNSKLIELYDELMNILPNESKSIIDCDSPKTNKQHMYNNIKCILINTYSSTRSTNQDNYKKIIIIAIWIKFMIEHNLSDPKEIFETNDIIIPSNFLGNRIVPGIKIKLEEFKKFLQDQYKLLENIETSVIIRGPKENQTFTDEENKHLIEKKKSITDIAKRLENNNIYISDYENIILQYGFTQYNSVIDPKDREVCNYCKIVI